MTREPFVHPYIPNSVPETRQAMLREIGVRDVEELYAPIPERLRFKGELDVPGPIHSEAELKRAVCELLDRNLSTDDCLSFLGGGVAKHYVPAAVDEVVNRAEFLSAYCGANYSDLGKYQTRWEFNSQLAELLDVDVVSEPIYDWGTVVGSAIRMAARITGRSRALVAATTSPQRLSVARTMCQPAGMTSSIGIDLVGYQPATGQLDLDDLRGKLSADTAAVYVEVPSYLGVIEGDMARIAQLVHEAGALLVVGVDPISLGLLAAPGSYGADIVVGDLQSLGVHLSAGGGVSGFIAFDDDPVLCTECPLALYTILETERDGEYAFGEVMAERTSYGLREQGKDWVGTASGLWTIAAAVYMSLMGPKGFQEIGQTIIKRAHYAAARLRALPGVSTPLGDAFFKEFVVSFNDTGKRVADINQSLLERRIFGGLDLSADFPELGQSALYCVTELHTRADIDRLAAALGEVL
jgi:glycine dehydrogenase subunit 1